MNSSNNTVISLEIIDDNTPLEQNESVTLQFTSRHNFVAAREFLRDTAIVNIIDNDGKSHICLHTNC